MFVTPGDLYWSIEEAAPCYHGNYENVDRNQQLQDLQPYKSINKIELSLVRWIHYWLFSLQVVQFELTQKASFFQKGYKPGHNYPVTFARF